MNRIELSVQLSPEDRELIADAVANRLRGLLEDRPRLVDGDKLSAILGISRATIDRLVNTGKLPSVLVGRRRLYRPEDCVLALVKASQRSGGEAQ